MDTRECTLGLGKTAIPSRPKQGGTQGGLPLGGFFPLFLFRKRNRAVGDKYTFQLQSGLRTSCSHAPGWTRGRVDKSSDSARWHCRLWRLAPSHPLPSYLPCVSTLHTSCCRVSPAHDARLPSDSDFRGRALLLPHAHAPVHPRCSRRLHVSCCFTQKSVKIFFVKIIKYRLPIPFVCYIIVNSGPYI